MKIEELIPGMPITLQVEVNGELMRSCKFLKM